MKNLQFPSINNLTPGVPGQPLRIIDCAFLQTGLQEQIISVLTGMYPDTSLPYVVNGIVQGGATPDFSYTAGSIWYNGQLYQVAPTDINLTGSNVVICNVNQTYADSGAGGNPSPAQMSDSSIASVQQVNTVEITQGPSGSGTFDYSALIYPVKLASVDNNNITYSVPVQPAQNTLCSIVPSANQSANHMKFTFVARIQNLAAGIISSYFYLNINGSPVRQITCVVGGTASLNLCIPVSLLHVGSYTAGQTVTVTTSQDSDAIGCTVIGSILTCEFID